MSPLVKRRGLVLATYVALALVPSCGESDADDNGSGGTRATGGSGEATGGAASNATGGAASNATGGAAGGGEGGESSTGGHAGAGGGDGAFVVELGTAEDFVILAKSGVSSVPTSAITGDIGLSPSAATSLSGFSLALDATEVFATSTQVTGRVWAADFAAPTPETLTTAVSDMELAFSDAAARAADVTELGAGNIGGLDLEAGVYKWGTGLLIPSDVTLRGSATDVWIFQIAETLTVSPDVEVILAGGAVAENVFWQASGAVTLDTNVHFEGIVLAQTGISLATNASVNGRLFAQTAVTLDNNVVTEPEL